MPRAPKPKPDTTAIVGDQGPEIVVTPAQAEVIANADIETVDVGPVAEVVDGSGLEGLNLTATPPPPPAPAPVEEPQVFREPGDFDGYPIGVFVGLGVSETVIGDLGAFTVDPDTGLVTARA